MPGPFEGILTRVAEYYSGKLAAHGPNARGVDWKDADSQELRFQKLLEGIDLRAPFSINDVGCGYGALIDHLDRAGARYVYHGSDVSVPMIEEARRTHAGRAFVSSNGELPLSDHSVASGIFNVRLNESDADWRDYILATLETMNEKSARGFSFNMLTSYSDADKKIDRLYYGDPCFFFDHCKRRYSRHVALLHDYALWEFTILVRKALPG